MIKYSYIVVLLGLAACADDIRPVDSNADNQAPEPVATPASDELVSGSVAFGYEILGQPQVDQPTEIKLAILGNDVAANLRLTPGDGVQLGEAQAPNIAISAGQETVTVTVIVEMEGRSYLNVLLERAEEGGAKMVAQRIPIQVGTVAPLSLRSVSP